MSAIAIRPFVDGDAATLSDLWVESWAQTYPDIDFEARRPWLADRLEAMLATGVKVLCAVRPERSELMGFVTIDPGAGHLNQLAVGVRHWGAGVADRLMEAAMEIAPARIALGVNQDNLRAIAFYRRHGFQTVGSAINPNSGRAIWHLEWQRAAG